MTGSPISRRLFLADLGRGAFAVAVLGLAGCAPSVTPSPSARSSSATPSGPPSGGPPSSGPSAAASASAGPSPADSGSAGGPGAPGGVAWSRVNLGFVSAYLLVRDGEGAIVDTGVAGSEGAIETAMTALGLGWTDIGNVILTHSIPTTRAASRPSWPPPRRRWAGSAPPISRPSRRRGR